MVRFRVRNVSVLCPWLTPALGRWVASQSRKRSTLNVLRLHSASVSNLRGRAFHSKRRNERRFSPDRGESGEGLQVGPIVAITSLCMHSGIVRSSRNNFQAANRTSLGNLATSFLRSTGLVVTLSRRSWSPAHTVVSVSNRHTYRSNLPQWKRKPKNWTCVT